MPYYSMIDNAIGYMERHLNESISHIDVAGHVHMSVPHLYRIFQSMTGYTLGQYLRMRRLTEAAISLRHGTRILDTAIEYQFESQEGFIRAFKAMFGVTPGEYRKSPSIIPLFRRISLVEQQNTGDIAMQPKIETCTFMLVGLEAEIDVNINFSAAVTSLTDKLRELLPGISHVAQPPCIINFWYPRFDDDAPMTREPKTMLFTGVEVTALSKTPVDMCAKALPESMFA